MGQYSIRDIEILSGVKAHTLRTWEQRYDFLKPERSESNIRFYTDEQLRLILNISTLNRSGMKISKIAGLPAEALCNEVEKICCGESEPCNVRDGLIRAMIDFDEARFEKTLSCAILKRGFTATFNEIMFPLLSRTGVLWSTGVIRPAQEHFMSNLIRRKLLSAIDNQFVKKTAASRKMLLFLPEWEIHELVLLYSEYLLREHGHEVVYLGCSVPFGDVEFAVNSFNPHFLLTFFTMPLPEVEMQSYINKLATGFPLQKTICGGKQTEMQRLNLPANAVVVNTPEQLIAALA